MVLLLSISSSSQYSYPYTVPSIRSDLSLIYVSTITRHVTRIDEVSIGLIIKNSFPDSVSRGNTGSTYQYIQKVILFVTLSNWIGSKSFMGTSGCGRAGIQWLRFAVLVYVVFMCRGVLFNDFYFWGICVFPLCVYIIASFILCGTLFHTRRYAYQVPNPLCFLVRCYKIKSTNTHLVHMPQNHKQ